MNKRVLKHIKDSINEHCESLKFVAYGCDRVCAFCVLCVDVYSFGHSINWCYCRLPLPHLFDHDKKGVFS